MNRNKIIVAFLTFFCLVRINLQAQNATGTITFRIMNFKHDQGGAIVNLFRTEDNLPKEPFRQERATIINGIAIVKFENLKYGVYAAIAFHDENSNGELDHSWGIPSEPIGFTNRWKLSLFSGMPNFNKLKFIFSQQINECNIELP